MTRLGSENCLRSSSSASRCVRATMSLTRRMPLVSRSGSSIASSSIGSSARVVCGFTVGFAVARAFGLARAAAFGLAFAFVFAFVFVFVFVFVFGFAFTFAFAFNFAFNFAFVFAFAFGLARAFLLFFFDAMTIPPRRAPVDAAAWTRALPERAGCAPARA